MSEIFNFVKEGLENTKKSVGEKMKDLKQKTGDKLDHLKSDYETYLEKSILEKKEYSPGRVPAMEDYIPHDLERDGARFYVGKADKIKFRFGPETKVSRERVFEASGEKTNWYKEMAKDAKRLEEVLVHNILSQSDSKKLVFIRSNLDSIKGNNLEEKINKVINFSYLLSEKMAGQDVENCTYEVWQELVEESGIEMNELVGENGYLNLLAAFSRSYRKVDPKLLYDKEGYINKDYLIANPLIIETGSSDRMSLVYQY